MIGWVKQALSRYIMRTGRGRRYYKRLSNPNGREWALFLKRWGSLHAMGTDVEINQGCNITDPSLVRLGNNVSLSDCTLLGHDGVISVLGKRYGKKLDSVGAIDIRDNCFIGHGAIIMPRVTIGPDSIVAAGAIVTKDVPQGSVVGGNPARLICTTEQLLEKIEARCATYPWMDLIRQREGAFDAELEPTLTAMRVKHFFGDHSHG